MQRLSSRSTFFHKRVMPVLWFGPLSAAAIFLVYEGFASAQGVLFFAAILPLAFVLLGIRLFKQFVLDLADAVWLDGDRILVFLGKNQSVIELNNINDVETKMIQNPPRVTLALREPRSPFGDCVNFVPVAAFSLWGVVGGNSVADEFKRRLDASGRPG